MVHFSLELYNQAREAKHYFHEQHKDDILTSCPKPEVAAVQFPYNVPLLTCYRFLFSAVRMRWRACESFILRLSYAEFKTPCIAKNLGLSVHSLRWKSSAEYTCLTSVANQGPNGLMIPKVHHSLPQRNISLRFFLSFFLSSLDTESHRKKPVTLFPLGCSL